jgi:hypothetical protein
MHGVRLFDRTRSEISPSARSVRIEHQYLPQRSKHHAIAVAAQRPRGLARRWKLIKKGTRLHGKGGTMDLGFVLPRFDRSTFWKTIEDSYGILHPERIGFDLGEDFQLGKVSCRRLSRIGFSLKSRNERKQFETQF